MAFTTCTSLDEAAVVARLLLAAVFVAAGCAKLASSQARRDLRDVGAAMRLPLGKWGALALAMGECAIGVQLASGYGIEVGASIALVVLTVFSVVLGVLLSRGFAGRCACFGGVVGDSIGASQIARNISLAAVAGLVAARAGTTDCVARPLSEVSWWAWASALVVLAAGALALLLVGEVERFRPLSKR